MVAIGKRAWLALTNRKSTTTSRRSPVQTRPRLLPEISRFTRSCLFSRPQPRQLVTLNGRQTSDRLLPSAHLACRPHRPRRAIDLRRGLKTPEQGPREISRHQPDPPSDGETQANTADGFWASGAPPVKASGCPRNRVMCGRPPPRKGKSGADACRSGADMCPACLMRRLCPLALMRSADQAPINPARSLWRCPVYGVSQSSVTTECSSAPRHPHDRAAVLLRQPGLVSQPQQLSPAFGSRPVAS